MSEEKKYTPALGYAWLTPLYDLAIALLTRERSWRRLLVQQISPTQADRLIDVGCGTGSLAILLKKQAPDAQVLGIDPDPTVLTRAKKKADKYGVEVDWRCGFLTDEVTAELPTVTKAVSSLVLHQVSLGEKQRILKNAHDLLEPGGELHIADYGRQRTTMMRFLFRWTVQCIDGIEDTQANADGILPAIIAKAGFGEIREYAIIPTFTGSISLYRATRSLDVAL